MTIFIIIDNKAVKSNILLNLSYLNNVNVLFI